MSRQDESRWDAKWAAAQRPFAPHPLLTAQAQLLAGGLALDLACGLGQNSLWLAGRGYRVLGVDISGVALRAAQQEAVSHALSGRSCFMQVDLDEWPIPKAAFDLILVFRFLDRRLFPAIQAGLRPGGLLFYSTRHQGMLGGEPRANPAYLLAPGELAAVFAGWEIVHERESHRDAELIAVKR